MEGGLVQIKGLMDDEVKVKVDLCWSLHLGKGKVSKKNPFFGIFFPNVFTHPPTPGFCEIWETKGEI